MFKYNALPVVARYSKNQNTNGMHVTVVHEYMYKNV